MINEKNEHFVCKFDKKELNKFMNISNKNLAKEIFFINFHLKTEMNN